MPTEADATTVTCGRQYNCDKGLLLSDRWRQVFHFQAILVVYGTLLAIRREREAEDRMNLKQMLAVVVVLAVSSGVRAQDEQAHYFEAFQALCGQAFAGAVVMDNRNDQRFADKKIILHIRDCSDREIRMPMHVGNDHSRTFILSRIPEGLLFKHDHRHEDGSPDALTFYGGVATHQGTATKQSFPVDEETKRLFTEHGLAVSLDNVWTISFIPGKSISYELKRPNREFRIKFDLNNKVSNPPVAWGYEATSTP